MLLPLLLSAAKNAADTTHKIDFAQKLESFSDMSLRQMVLGNSIKEKWTL